MVVLVLWLRSAASNEPEPERGEADAASSAPVHHLDRFEL
jgi:hypothetical protein